VTFKNPHHTHKKKREKVKKRPSSLFRIHNKHVIVKNQPCTKQLWSSAFSAVGLEQSSSSQMYTDSEAPANVGDGQKRGTGVGMLVAAFVGAVVGSVACCAVASTAASALGFGM